MPLVARLRRPVRIAVTGRRGTGVATVSAALRQRGVLVTESVESDSGDSDGESDGVVVVVAEFVKPEDVPTLRAGRPALVVLTKADLTGRGPDGPVALARRRAAAIEAVTATPTVPMVGLLAALDPVTGLDDEMVAALLTFTTTPPNLAGVDAFVDDPHPVARDVRVRLLQRLDRFGVAHAVVALAAGVDPADLPQRLRRLGNADEVMVALEAVTARAGYRRIRDAIGEVRRLAVHLDSTALADLLTDDETVLNAMTAAVAVVEADGLVVDRGDTAAAHLDRAVRWRRYGRGPCNALHQACSADIVRGSLRLLAAAGKPAP